jgi:hypothetical protein
MNTTLPSLQTQQPSRAGLAYHEILADGLIHAAAVCGFEPNERYVERLAALAWANGTCLIQDDFSRAAEIAGRLGESLEIGRTETTRVSKELQALAEGVENPIDAARAFYAEKRQSRALRAGRPEDAAQIRHLIGEAALGGLVSRGQAPELYRSVCGQLELVRYESAFLSTRLMFWARESESGLPCYHPLVELTTSFYNGRPKEKRLVCQSVGRSVAAILNSKDPWAPEACMNLAWKSGVVMARFAPDEVHDVLGEFDADTCATILKFFEEHVRETGATESAANLPAAFEHFVTTENPYGLADEDIRQANPRILAVRAYDFALWMGIIAELPGAFGEIRGVA